MTITIAVLSDTHLSNVTGEFEKIHEQYLSDKDYILHAGDFVSIRVVKFLEGANFHGVQGNMDPVEVRAALPVKKVIKVGSFRLGLIHGWGSPKGLEERLLPEFQGVDAIIYGHSHRPANHLREGVLLFNPGTAGGHILSSNRTMGILRIGDDIRGEIINI